MAMITVFFFLFFFSIIYFFIAVFLDDAMELKCLVHGMHNGRCCRRLASRRTRQERRDQTFGHHTHIDAAPPFQTQVSLQDISRFERSNMLWLFSRSSSNGIQPCSAALSRCPRPWFSVRRASSAYSRLLTIGLATSAVDRHNIC